MFFTLVSFVCHVLFCFVSVLMTSLANNPKNQPSYNLTSDISVITSKIVHTISPIIFLTNYTHHDVLILATTQRTFSGENKSISKSYMIKKLYKTL